MTAGQADAPGLSTSSPKVDTMPKPSFAIIVTGLNSEEHALALTKALLNLQRQRQQQKPAWRTLEFRPYCLTADQAKALIEDAPPVILNGEELATRGPARQLAPPEYPTLKRVR